MSRPEGAKVERDRRPSFAEAYPRVPELDELVRAFEEGDFARVRRDAGRLAEAAEDTAVRLAARELVERTKADRLAVLLFVITGGLLLLLTGYWLVRNGPAPGPAPPVEHVR